MNLEVNKKVFLKIANLATHLIVKTELKKILLPYIYILCTVHVFGYDTFLQNRKLSFYKKVCPTKPSYLKQRMG